MAFDVDGARKAGYSDAEIADHLAKAQGFNLSGARQAGYSDADVISHLAARVAPAPKPAPGIVDRIVGAGEAALATGTGALLGGTLGVAGGLVKNALDPEVPFYLPPGTDPAIVKAAMEKSRQNFNESMGAVTYAPRTEAGQEYAQATGDALQQLLPAAIVAPALAVPGAVSASRSGAPLRTTVRAATEGTARDIAGVAGPAAGDAAAAITSGAIDAGAAAARATGTVLSDTAKKATTLPRRAIDAVRGDSSKPTPGTLGSAGAAGTDAAAQRIATAENLGFSGDTALTVGQATRDPAQLKFEVETAKLPEQGARLRERQVAQNEQFWKTMDNWVDKTGAEAPTLRAVGQAVDKALVEQASRDKSKIRALYKQAEKAGELEAPVALDSVVAHLNDSAPDAATAPLLDVARRRAVQQGIAAEEGGQLVPRPVPLKIAETFRQAVGRATDFEPTNVRQSTIIKGLVDEATDGLGGNLYRQARAERRRFAQNFEDRAAIQKLLNTKRGMSDRQVALEDVFGHTMLQGSLDDVRNVRRVLQRGGDEGKQAWRELQGQTVRYIRDEAFGNTATDSAGTRVISAAKLDRALKELDADGKLDFIFGKQGAQQMRDIRDLAQYARTVPPEAAINHSNTAATLLTGFGDLALSAVTGVPAPLATGMRIGVKQIQDAKLRKRITDALTAVERRQRAQQSERSAAPTF